MARSYYFQELRLLGSCAVMQYEELERAVSEVHARHKAEDAEAMSKLHREHLENRNRLQLLGEYET
jgi:hypothetical protein